MRCIVVCVCVYSVMKMSELKSEQERNIKFLVKQGNTENEILEVLVQVCGENTMMKTMV